MRVIAGKYKKRQLKVPKSQLTRPTTDKNKENLFNMIGPYFQGGTVLDLFGGSGGLGIEAISRGCDTLYSVDHQYEAFKTIKENFSLLKLENCFPLKMDYKKALKYLYEKGIKFDYVFLDPPYGKGLVDDILQYLVDHQMLNPQACIVVEELKEVEFKEIEGIELNKRKEYGITASRGKWIERKGILYMPTWHPAALLRDESKKIDFIRDLQEVMRRYR